MYRLNKDGGIVRIDDGAFIPEDAGNVDFQAYLAWRAEGNEPATEPAPPEAIMVDFVAKAQARLDEFARTRNYDGILSACTYATSSVPKFAAEGQRAVDLRDQTWAALYEVLAEVQGGQRPAPVTFSDIEPDLPALTWV